jgi:hypothetical protein
MRVEVETEAGVRVGTYQNNGKVLMDDSEKIETFPMATLCTFISKFCLHLYVTVVPLRLPFS